MESIDYRHRPAVFRAVNSAGRLLRRAGVPLVSLDEADLLEEAQRRTGLRQFGDDAFREPFRLLLRALEGEARLNLIGRAAARSHLLQLLENRLRLEEDRRKDADISRQQIKRPVFITGLPRTGTTILHGLLSQDAANRVPMTWEIMFVSPPPKRATRQTDPRIEKTDRLLQWVNRLAPRFKAIHPVGAGLPQECIAMTAHAFASLEFHTTHDVPSYQKWLDEQGAPSAYAYHHRLLQQLQRHCPADRWVLKAPAHLHDLDALFAQYPDARIVHTHRDPLKVIGSIASHGVVLRAAFSDHIDASAIAAWWSRWWSKALTRAMVFRETAPSDRFIDVFYEDIVSDPIRVVREVYDQLGFPLTRSAEQAMRTFLRRHPKDKHGKHRYTLSQFGLDTRREDQRYGAYRARFGVRREG